MKKYLLSSIVCVALLNAASIDEDLAGFDNAPVVATPQSNPSEADALMAGFDDAPPRIKDKAEDMGFDVNSTDSEETCATKPIEAPKEAFLLNGLSGKVGLEYAYSPNAKEPFDNSNALRGELFLDYDTKFSNGWRLKVNAKGYYDAIYEIRGKEKFGPDVLDELEREVELYDAYLQGSITDILDFKVGRQVVVWGRSDTIRITDVLNPLDNRRPGMVDIEDLRLPVAMAKFDYFIENWRITPIVVLEQRFSKLAPAQSAFNPLPLMPENEKYSDVTYALSIGAEFEGWDVNLYASRLRDDAGYIDSTMAWHHDKVNMAGAALNYLSGEWLFKTELAYFDGLKYTTLPGVEKNRLDALVGFEYEGFSDTSISYDISVRHLYDYSAQLQNEFLPILEENTYQHALRISRSFMNDRVNANYLISLFGKSLDEGGFQRLWVDYELAEGWSATAGFVDYRGGSAFYDIYKDNDMLFTSVNYSF